MAGQGIRSLELAKVLAQHLSVRLAVPERCDLEIPGVEVVLYRYGDTASLEQACKGVSAIFAEPFILHAYPTIFNSELPLVIDLYNPFVLEHLAVHQELPLDAQISRFYENVELCNAVCARGDFFTCATERQRDWWLGVLQANGRINPLTIATDPHLRRLIDVVAYGIPQETPAKPSGATGAKSTFPMLAPEDKIILWGGGLWNWLDPLTLIRAMPTVLAAEPRAKLLFPGTRHPNTTIVPDMAMRRAAEEAAEALGLAGSHILFGDWVPYEQWGAYLAEADVAVSFHHESPETRFAALRSRVFGYLGARLPMVVQTGDRAGEVVQSYGLGEVVPPYDPDAAAAALIHVLQRGKAAYHDHFTPLLETLAWETVAAALIAFARSPHRAPDRLLQRGAYPLQQQHKISAEQEIHRLQRLVQGYENGRLMRLLNRLHRLRQLPQTLRTMPTPPSEPLRLDSKPRTPGEAVRHMARLAGTFNFIAIKRELENYAAWKVPPLRRAAERQLRRLRRRRRTDAAPTRLHELYTYQLFDLGDEHPALRGIYTPGYRSETVGNYLQEQFTENAELYAEKYTNYDYITGILEPVLRQIGFDPAATGTILDIGSGAGNSIFPLLKLCPSAYIIASDLSIQLLKLLEVALKGTGDEKRVELLQLNAEELDFLPNSLDLVVGVAVLHHLFEPERTIEGCATVLKKGGYVILLEPFAEGCLTLARLYREILAHPRAGELHEEIHWLLGALAQDFEVRSIPDKTLPLFNQLDDKQLFTRAFFQEQAQKHGFAECTITPLGKREGQYEEQTRSFLRITRVGTRATLPEWAWELLRAEDATLTEAVPIEACVVLRK